MTTNLDNLLKMFFALESKFGSEEAEKWLSEQEIDLSPAEVLKAERMLAQMTEAENG